MVSNGIVVADDGKGQVIGNQSGLPNRAIEKQTVADQTEAMLSEAGNASRFQREIGDHVNRFLLCALVSESAKHIKASAMKMGQPVPMTMIVRGVLTSYRLAATDKYGPLAGPDLNIDGLSSLNATILRNEIERHSREKVKESEMRASNEKRLF